MKLYFRNSYGHMRELCQIDDTRTSKQVTSEIMREIRQFCKERKFHIYYTRIWDVPSENRTMFDVGSHTEFFVTEPACYELFMKSKEGTEEDTE